MKLKNQFIKFILFCFTSKKKRRVASPKRFLIVSTTGLGDTLWATPSLKALKQSYPYGEISVLTSPLGGQVLENNPHVDFLYILKKPLFFSLLRHLLPLKRRHFDAILIFHTSQRLLLPFCALLNAPQIVGTKGLNKDLDFILTHPLEKKREHEIERRLEIIRQVGAISQDSLLELFPVLEDEKQLACFLQKHGITKQPLIGLHPGAQKTFKQWPASHFIQLGLKLIEKLGCKIIVTGDAKERALVSYIASHIPGSIPMAGDLSLSALALLQKQMALFITNDTGPMHMALSIKTPTLALFGPTDHELCGPHLAKNGVVIQKKKTCNPCLMKKCEEPFCLFQIGINEVYEKALNLVQFNF